MEASNIEIKRYDEDNFIMIFTASCGKISVEFIVSEPYMTSHDEWINFATTDKSGIGLYSGSG